MEERPNYSPWVAAVWVDPQHRGKGIGAAIVRQAAEQALKRGFETIYLCALPEKSGFYEQLGWRLLERDVGEHSLRVLYLLHQTLKVAHCLWKDGMGPYGRQPMMPFNRA